MYPIQWPFWASKSGQDWHFVKCSAACTHTPFVFNQLPHACLQSSKPSYLLSEELEQLRWQYIELHDLYQHQQNVQCVAHTQAHTRDIPEAQLSGTCSALIKFPPEVTVIECNAIIVDWMDEMDLNKFIQMCCAVCGQWHCAKDIKLVPPTDINFTLLRNSY